MSKSNILRVADWPALLEMGWTAQTVQQRITELDRAEMEGLTESAGGTPTQWSPIFANHQESWRVLLNAGDEIVAYWHFVVLNPRAYRKAVEGQLAESSIALEDLVAFELQGSHDLYFAGFVIDQRYRTPPIFQQLLWSFLDVLQALASEEVFMREICANAFTSNGESICQTLGMQWKAKHFEHGQIFVGALPDLLRNRIARKHPQLQRLYGLAPQEENLDGSVITIVFLASNSDPQHRLDIEREQRLLGERLQSSTYRNSVRLEIAVAAQADDLIEFVRKHNAEIVHFSGHGHGETIDFRNENGGPQPVLKRHLKDILQGRNVRLLVLNSCESSNHIVDYLEAVPSIISVVTKVSDCDAIAFSRRLYAAIANGLSLEHAFRNALDGIRANGSKAEYVLTGDGAQVFVGPHATLRWIRKARGSNS